MREEGREGHDRLGRLAGAQGKSLDFILRGVGILGRVLSWGQVRANQCASQPARAQAGMYLVGVSRQPASELSTDRGTKD